MRSYHVLFALWCALLATGCRRAARRDDTLTLLALTEPVHLDPRHPEDALGAALGRLVYRGLVDSDPRTFLPRPALARSIDRVDDTHLVAVLREDARFHDGSPVTADDVVATYRAILDPARHSRLRGTYKRVIASVEARDARTVLFTLVRRDGTIESLLQQPIMPRAEADGDERMPSAHPTFNGSGFVRTEHLGRDGWSFTRTTPTLGAPSRLRVVSLHDPNTLAQRLLHGDGDIAEIKPELFEVFTAHRDFEVVSAPSAGFTFLGVRCTAPGLGDARVRQALALALDRNGLRVGKFGARAVAATGPLPPSHWAYTGDVERYPYDPARARALLDAAGLPDPPGDAPRARWTLRVSSQRFAITTAQAMAAMLADVGIEVTVRPSELATLLSDLRGGAFDLTFLTIPDLSDPWGLTFWFGGASIPTRSNPGAGGNRWRYANSALDATLDAGATAIGPTQRAPHYREAQRILARDLPVIPLWHADVVFAMSRRFERLTPRGDGQLDFLLGLTRRQGWR